MIARGLIAALLIGCGPAAGGAGGASEASSRDRGDVDIAERGPAGFGLDPGVVVGPDHTIFAMSPLDRIAAIDPETGEILWDSTAGALPLFAAGDVLLAQAVVEREPGLHLVALDAETGEEIALCDPVALPDWVTPSIDEGLGFGFSVSADEIDDRLYVSWVANAWYAGGAAPSPEQEAAAEREADGSVEIVDLAECLAVEREVPELDDASSVADEGYVSADGQLELVIGPGPDGATMWQVYSVGGDELVAEFAGDPASPSFFVHGDVLIVASRLEVSGRRLSDGGVIWYYPIRMTTYTGPMPP